MYTKKLILEIELAHRVNGPQIMICNNQIYKNKNPKPQKNNRKSAPLNVLAFSCGKREGEYVEGEREENLVNKLLHCSTKQKKTTA